MAARLADRFRGFLPVIVDVETGGFDAERDALLEIAAVVIGMDQEGNLYPHPAVSTHVEAFPGANIDPRALEITGIDPDNPLRGALDERHALDHIFHAIRLGGATERLPARDPGRTQRSVRSWLSQCRRATRRSQAQPVPPFQLL